MASVGTVPAPAQSRPWGVAKWFAFRFTFAYLVLYNNPVGMLAALVQSEGIGRVWERVEHPVVQWFARDVLRMPNPITIFPSGSGDTTYNYVQIVFYAVVSFLVAAAWTVLRKRQEEPRAVYALLRTYVRYCLALTLLNYGTIKLFKDQFPALGPEKLLQTYGESSPMGLLWRFMGYSTAYTFFGGAIEFTSGSLLLFRRTTLAGALLGTGALANIVMLNFSYDVPVKLYSAHLFLMCVFLVVPDWRRLAGMFLLGRAVPAPDAEFSFAPWIRKPRWVAKPLLVAAMVLGTFYSAFAAYREYGDGSPRPALAGTYAVVEPAGSGWKTVLIGKYAFAIELADSRTERSFYQSDATHHKLTLFSDGEASIYTYQQTGSNGLVLSAQGKGSVKLRRIADRKFPLLERGFHWINEYPFNRQ